LLIRVVVLALLRYMVFTCQFYLLLLFFGVEVPFIPAWILVSVIFYVMVLVPTIALTELGVRGAVAAYFFSRITDQLPGVLNATVSLWLFNLAIPAMIGTGFVFMFHFEKRKT